MKKQFSAYYTPSESEFKELWDNCIFVLDTNVLLNLYRYPQNARNDLFKVLKKIESRLWIPHQVALEFQENRLSTIAEQVKRFDQVRKVLADSLISLNSGLDKLQLKKRHSTIDPEAFLKSVQEDYSKFEGKLKDLEENQPTVSSQDSIRSQLDELLKGKIGRPYDIGELEELYKDGSRRFDQKRPPGYLDASKQKEIDKDGSDYFFNGCTIKREFGDLLIWRQIIDEAKSRSSCHLIFVTDEENDDWWWKVDSKGTKTIGPRPELVNEIREAAGVANFYIYTSEHFLKYAEKALRIKIESQSIKQVQEIAQLQRQDLRETSLVSRSAFALPAVFSWITSTYPDCQIIGQSGRGVDFLVSDKSRGKVIGFDVKFRFQHIGFVPSVKDHLLSQAPKLISRSGFHEFKLVIVTIGEDSARKLIQIARGWLGHEVWPEGVSLVVGWLEPSNTASSIPYVFRLAGELSIE